MNIRKVSPLGTMGKASVSLPGSTVYDWYIAVDWSMRTMAIASMKADDQAPRVWQGSSSERRLIEFIDGCEGRTILTLEETTGAHWLYGKLLGHVDRLIVCDPTHNRLLCAGPKNDRIDAAKLCLLLRQGNLKEVYHSTSELYNLRLLVSAAEDIIRNCVSAKNRLKAQYRSHGDETSSGRLVIRQLNEEIALHSAQKKAIECEFQATVKRNGQLRHLTRVPGIGFRGAVRILGTVIDARRFPGTGHYLSYCGLVWHQKHSGGRYYGRRRPRYSRILKCTYKRAALAVLRGDNPFGDLYRRLRSRGVAEHNARHQVARHIASITYGMMKSGRLFDSSMVTRGALEHNNS
jgi:transposase